ncbi:hypothetical protein BsWGS_26242 [Bradybaena similaris]
MSGDRGLDKTTKTRLMEPIVPIHKDLTEAGQFSYAALCATLLYSLFDSDDKKFKDETLSAILESLELPKQICTSAWALLHGHGQDDVDPYIDVLLEEKALQDGAEPIISQLVAIAVSQGSYDARVRVLIKEIAWRLKVDLAAVVDLETSVAETLALSQYEISEEERLEKAKKAKRRKYKRYALIGLATIGGGTLIGLTGGLAAPLVAAGAGAIIGGTGAAVLGSTAGVAIIGSLFGVAGAGLTGYKMKKRVGAIEEFCFEPLLGGSSLKADPLVKQLHVTIGVTGWLSESNRDFKEPWKELSESKEQYVLCWESKYLMELGQAFSYIINSAMTAAAKQALKFTVLRGLLAAITWPAALISAGAVIDNPWSVAVQRSQATGRMLAEVLLAREQGNRPVTLIGFSLGARVIFSCLEELSKRKGCEGIVEDAILLGAPAPADPQIWAKFAHVVAGKVVNGYCRGDWLLKFLYRASSVQMRIAGLCPVKWEDRRMHNIDLTDVVSGHLDYKQQLGTVMRAVGIQTKTSSASSSSLDKTSIAEASASSASSVGIIDELSSSDDDMFLEVVKPESGGERGRQTSISCLTHDKGYQSESVSTCVKGESEDSFIITESLSTDSGIASTLESESVSAYVKGESEDSFTIPESVSTDSRIASRLEPESEELLNSWDQLSVTSDHSCDLQYSGRNLPGKKDSND